jgi:hypothetical protein
VLISSALISPQAWHAQQVARSAEVAAEILSTTSQNPQRRQAATKAISAEEHAATPARQNPDPHGLRINEASPTKPAHVARHQHNRRAARKPAAGVDRAETPSQDRRERNDVNHPETAHFREILSGELPLQDSAVPAPVVNKESARFTPTAELLPAPAPAAEKPVQSGDAISLDALKSGEALQPAPRIPGIPEIQELPAQKGLQPAHGNEIDPSFEIRKEPFPPERPSGIKENNAKHGDLAFVARISRPTAAVFRAGDHRSAASHCSCTV